MRVKSLFMSNYLSHKNTKLEFSDRINVIVGPNGSGKSSILDAIYFALFGKTNRVDKLYSLLRRERGKPSQMARVDLRFTQEGKEYGVSRIIRKVDGDARTEEAKLTLEKSVIAVGAKKVTEELSRILGVDERLFQNAVYVAQGELGKFLGALSPTERRRAFAKIIGLTDFDTAIDALRHIKRKFEKEAKQLSDLQGKLEEARKELEERERRLPELQAEIDRLKAEKEEVGRILEEKRRLLDRKKEAKARLEETQELLKEKEKKLEELKSQISKLEEETKDMERLQRKFEELVGIEEELGLLEEMYELENDIRMKYGSIEELKENKERFESLRREIAELEGFEEKLNRVRSELESKKKEGESQREARGRLESAIESLKENIREKRAEIEEIRSSLGGLDRIRLEGMLKEAVERQRALEESLRKLNEEKGRIEGEIGVAEGEIRHLEERGDRCPTCGKPLTPEERDRIIEGKRKKVEELKEKLESVKERLEALRSEADGLGAKIEELEQKLERAEKLAELEQDLLQLESELKVRESDFRGIEEALNRLEKDISELEAEKEKLEATVKELDRKRGEIEVYRKMGDLEKLISEATKEYGEMKRKLEGLKSDYLRKFKRLPLYGEENLEKMRRKKEEKAELERRLTDLREVASRLKAKREELGSLENEIKALEAKLNRFREEAQGLEELDREVAEYTERHRRAIAELASREMERKGLEEETIPRIRSQIEDLEKRISELGKRRRAADLASKLAEKMDKEIKERYNASVLSALKVNFPKYIESLGLDYSRVDIDGNLNLTLVTQDGTQISYRELSGGERILVSLAFRLALLAAIAAGIGKREAILEPPPLMLDEPTIHLDEEHRENVIKALEELQRVSHELPIPQMIIVSHYTDLQDVADRVFSLSKGREGSVVEVVD